MKLKDLTGQRFGRLTVLERSPENMYGEPAWICLCDCGNRKTVNGGALKSGRVRSCGCLAVESSHRKWQNYKDITGQVFGRLTVIRPTDKRRESDNCVIWECVCKCGNTAFVPSTTLITGHSKSCGCLGEEHRLKAIRRETMSAQTKEKRREASKKNWPDAEKWIGMVDDTNISIIKIKKARADSSTGVRGVYEKKSGSYMASLTFQKVTYKKYGFKTIEEAAKARARMYEEIVEPYLQQREEEQNAAS